MPQRMGNHSSQPTLEIFNNIYKHPEQIFQNSGLNKEIIGCLGNDIPIELLIAAKGIPIRVLRNVQDNYELSNTYLESGFDPRTRAQLASVVSNTSESIDHLIISNSSDALIRVYYYLRAITYYEDNYTFPKPYFFDFLHSRSRICALYNRDRMLELKKELENWMNCEITKSDLMESIELCNETRFLLQELENLRATDNVKISGVLALQIITSSMLLERTYYNQLLRSFLDEIHTLPQLKGVRLFVAGSTHENDAFYQLVESCGAVIVGESHDYSSLSFRGGVDTHADPIDAITDFYHFRERPTSQATVSERVSSLTQEVTNKGAQGVIFFIHRADDASLWDYPEQVKALKKVGIPCLVLDEQPFFIEVKNLKNHIQDFIHSINQSQLSEKGAE